MRNILYYLKKFGHCTFEERPFSDVDSLILSAMSYMMFDGVVPALGEEKDSVGIGRLQSEFVLNRLVVNTMDPKLNRKLWRLLAACPRFKEMRLHYLRDVTDDGIIEQFAAVTCLLPGEGLHICFRGTDLTLLGWKEDFNMSYLDEVPAQAEAVRYVNEVAALTEGKIYIGGHSKGGNLAMYAAMNCQDGARERIAGVFNHDGPGFRTDVFNTHITLTTVKTADTIRIELNKYSRAILDKYTGDHFKGNLALPVISNQRMNDYLKDVGKVCEIDTPITVTYYKGNERIDEVFPKWQLLGTHAGRRTFICNALSLGISPQVVMKWTGHSDYKAMKPYIDIADTAKVEAMKLFDR